MMRVAGITFEKDSQGENRFVKIDLKKQAERINPILDEMGALEADEFDKD